MDHPAPACHMPEPTLGHEAPSPWPRLARLWWQAAEGLEQQALFRGAYCNRTAPTGDYGAVMEGV
jgi:hypothetical protein